MEKYMQKYSLNDESHRENAYGRVDNSQTPSKKGKYDSYTPRKRYMKEHE